MQSNECPIRICANGVGDVERCKRLQRFYDWKWKTDPAFRAEWQRFLTEQAKKLTDDILGGRGPWGTEWDMSEEVLGKLAK